MRTFFHVCLSSVFSCCSTFSELFPRFSHSFTSFSHLNMYNLCIPTLESLYTFFQRILSTRRFFCANCSERYLRLWTLFYVDTWSTENNTSLRRENMENTLIHIVFLLASPGFFCTCSIFFSNAHVFLLLRTLLYFLRIYTFFSLFHVLSAHANFILGVPSFFSAFFFRWLRSSNIILILLTKKSQGGY